MVFSGVDQNVRKVWENNPSQLHEVIVNFLNEEKFEQLVHLCKDIFKASASYHDKYLFAKKVIFDLINLDQSFWAVQMYKAYLKIFPGEVFIFEVIEEFMRYGNYEGALNTLYGFADPMIACHAAAASVPIGGHLAFKYPLFFPRCANAPSIASCMRLMCSFSFPIGAMW